MSATKTIKYVGRHRGGVLVQPDPEVDEWVEVKYLGHADLPTDTANRLLEQEDEWHPVKAAKKAAPKSAPAPAEADTPADVGTPQED